jgi:hypothetical protein
MQKVDSYQVVSGRDLLVASLSQAVPELTLCRCATLVLGDGRTLTAAACAPQHHSRQDTARRKDRFVASTCFVLFGATILVRA